MDGLISVAYPDDKVVERVVVQRFEPSKDGPISFEYRGDQVLEQIVAQDFESVIAWVLANPSEQLVNALAALASGDPVVYVRVDDDVSWRKS